MVRPSLTSSPPRENSVRGSGPSLSNRRNSVPQIDVGLSDSGRARLEIAASPTTSSDLEGFRK